MKKKLVIVPAALACLWGTAAFAEPPAAPETEPATPAAETAADTAPTSASTEGAPAETGKTKWEFINIPYVWATSSKSTFTTRQGESVTSKLSFFDLLGDLKFGLMGAGEAKHGRLVLTSDFVYGHLGSSASGHVGPIPLTAKVSLKTLLATGLAGYRVLDKGPMYVDLLAGVRLTALRADLELMRPLQTNERNFKKTHVAPVLASRFRAPLGGRWGAYIYGDVGGFGISSVLSWQLMGTVQYDLSKHWQLGGGWRHLYGRDEKRGFKVQQVLDGPIVTLSYRM
jgi:hypothetical protein